MYFSSTCVSDVIRRLQEVNGLYIFGVFLFFSFISTLS